MKCKLASINFTAAFLQACGFYYELFAKHSTEKQNFICKWHLSEPAYALADSNKLWYHTSDTTLTTVSGLIHANYNPALYSSYSAIRKLSLTIPPALITSFIVFPQNIGVTGNFFIKEILIKKSFIVTLSYPKSKNQLTFRRFVHYYSFGKVWHHHHHRYACSINFKNKLSGYKYLRPRISGSTRINEEFLAIHQSNSLVSCV